MLNNAVWELQTISLNISIQHCSYKIPWGFSVPLVDPQVGKPVMGLRTFTTVCELITADGDCSHEIKRCLLLGRKAMTNLDSILKSRDITLPTRVHIVKAMVFQ